MKRKPIVIIIAMMFAFASILQFGTYLSASAEEISDGTSQITENEVIGDEDDLNETGGQIVQLRIPQMKKIPRNWQMINQSKIQAIWKFLNLMFQSPYQEVQQLSK